MKYSTRKIFVNHYEEVPFYSSIVSAFHDVAIVLWERYR